MPSSVPAVPAAPDPVEFSVEDAMLNTWMEDTGDYLRLESPAVTHSIEPPTTDE